MKIKITAQSDKTGYLSNAETPEQWWARSSGEERHIAHQIAQMMLEVSDDKRIEIRKEVEKIRARFVHILKRPEGGCLNAIMLPEPTRCSWN